jgi:hypothetical protein
MSKLIKQGPGEPPKGQNFSFHLPKARFVVSMRL